MGGLANLEYLYLKNNQLTGCIPMELRDVPYSDIYDLGLPFCDASSGDDTASCATGSTVEDAANNPGLVTDCDTLLAARDTLAGSAALNWSARIAIERWEGVTVDGTPLRVTELDLSNGDWQARLHWNWVASHTCNCWTCRTTS